MVNSGYCRLCAEIKLYSNLSVIKNEDEFSKNLCLQISQCFQIQITSDDNLPKTICFDCCTQTNNIYEFFQKVQNAQNYLRKIVTNQLENNVNFQIDFMQPIVQIVTNENSIENIGKTKAEDTGQIEVDTNVSGTDKFTQPSEQLVSNENNLIKKLVKTKAEDDANEFDEFWDNESSENNSERTVKKTNKNKKNRKKIGRTKSLPFEEEFKGYTFRCNTCSSELKNKIELITHFREEHNKKPEYSCLDCSKSFTEYSLFTRHVRIHKNYNKFRCNLCGKAFHDIHIYRSHMRYTHEQAKLSKYVCTVCGKVFKWLASFKYHKSNFHVSSQEKLKYECDICHKKVITDKALIAHKKVHDESSKRFTCEQCGHGFRQSGNLREHVKNVHSENNKDNYLQCPICPTKLKNETQLRKHKRQIHCAEKRYECSYCGKKYYVLSYFKLHERIHTGERPYQCQYCQKCFRRKDYLDRHIRQHTGEKPYCCLDCDHYFTDFSNYIKHMRGKHGVTSFKNINKGNTDTK